jgi:hypothetical protein
MTAREMTAKLLRHWVRHAADLAGENLLLLDLFGSRTEGIKT